MKLDSISRSKNIHKEILVTEIGPKIVMEKNGSLEETKTMMAVQLVAKELKLVDTVVAE